MLRLFRVRGRSMLPTLRDGDFVVARRLTGRARRGLRPGQIVCVDHPHYGRLVKRIGTTSPAGCALASDGAIGSEDLGTIPFERISHRGLVAITRSGIRWLHHQPPGECR